jgi:pyruvate,orthophosphate dikinase
MFFEGDRIDAMREMILADNLEDRKKPLSPSSCPISAKTSPASSRRSRACRPPSVCSIRRCTNSFRTKEQQMDLAKKIGVKPWKPSSSASHDLHEFNPMLGHRGCRLGIAYPEITEMQARAIFEAAADVARRRSR